MKFSIKDFLTLAWVFPSTFAVYLQKTFYLEHLWVAASVQSFLETFNLCSDVIYINFNLIEGGAFFIFFNG